MLEDTADSGRTLKACFRHLASKKPREVHCSTLLLKPGLVTEEIELDTVGFFIPDQAWAVGGGLDYKGYRFRGMPCIAIPVEKLHLLEQ